MILDSERSEECIGFITISLSCGFFVDNCFTSVSARFLTSKIIEHRQGRLLVFFFFFSALGGWSYFEMHCTL